MTSKSVRAKTRMVDVAKPGLAVSSVGGVGPCDGCQQPRATNRTAIVLAGKVSMLVLCNTCLASLREQLAPPVDQVLGQGNARAWKVGRCPRRVPGKSPWADPRYRVSGIFDDKQEAQRVADAFNAIEAEAAR